MAVDPVSRWKDQLKRKQGCGSCGSWFFKLVDIGVRASTFQWHAPGCGGDDSCQRVPVGCFDSCDVDHSTHNIPESAEWLQGGCQWQDLPFCGSQIKLVPSFVVYLFLSDLLIVASYRLLHRSYLLRRRRSFRGVRQRMVALRQSRRLMGADFQPLSCRPKEPQSITMTKAFWLQWLRGLRQQPVLLKQLIARRPPAPRWPRKPRSRLRQPNLKGIRHSFTSLPYPVWHS